MDADKTLSRRKQGFESPRERHWVVHRPDFLSFSRVNPKFSNAVWGDPVHGSPRREFNF
jgi:hypothetical protein